MKRKRQKTSKAPVVCSPAPYCPIVVMGASAGGLEVFGQFFNHLPPRTGLAYVLVQHLDPKHDTLMPELLSEADGDAGCTC